VAGHNACQGCPRLAEEESQRPGALSPYAIDEVTIAHFISCNIRCKPIGSAEQGDVPQSAIMPVAADPLRVAGMTRKTRRQKPLRNPALSRRPSVLEISGF
jgi:hypothetical protein